MTENYLFSRNSFLRNTANASCRVALNMHAGVLRGNIIDDPDILPTPVVEPPEPACNTGRLDFQCFENSGYVTLL